jgi:hypothetical protein
MHVRAAGDPSDARPIAAVHLESALAAFAGIFP